MDYAVLGAGWLGWRLALRLAESGQVVVSKQQPTQQQAPFTQHRWCYGERLPEQLLQAHTLIVCAAPRMRKQGESGYADAMLQVAAQAKNSAWQRILFCSSIGVYGESSGYVDETSPTEPMTDSARAVLQAEQAMLATGVAVCSLRLAGLVGFGRHPIKQLAGRELENGNKVVNLVHGEDVITLMLALLDKTSVDWPQLLNVVAAEHPTRADYYAYCARHYQLPAPSFITAGTGGKIIDGTRLAQLDVVSLRSPWQMLD